MVLKYPIGNGLAAQYVHHWMNAHDRRKVQQASFVINPELGDPYGISVGNFEEARQVVGELFGIADKAIVRAIEQFVARDPGPLDHVLLRIVAAAAPVIADSRSIVKLIHDLPVTGMRVAFERIDVSQLHEDLQKCLSGNASRMVGRHILGPDTRRRLVRDLIFQTVWDVVGLAPPDALPMQQSSFTGRPI